MLVTVYTWHYYYYDLFNPLHFLVPKRVLSAN